MKKANINDKVIVLFGVGGTQKAVLHYLPEYFDIDPNKLFMFDKIDYTQHPDIKKWIDKGAKYFINDINENYEQIISKLKPYEIVIDLTNRTPSIKIFEFCKKYNVHYINTSLEDKDSPKEVKKKEEEFEQTYQFSHNEINRINKEYSQNKATSVLEFGMNPGMISICTKDAILFLARSEKKRSKELQTYIDTKSYNKICEYLNVKLIHCSETDSAIYVGQDENPNKFTNTWCPVAWVDEYSDDLQFTYGSDQKKIPKKAKLLYDNIINMNKPSSEIYSESYVPIDGKFIGCCISHGEGISLGSFLSTEDYSPTMHYVYKWSPIAQKSLSKLDKKYIGGTPPNPHTLNNYDDTFKGVDIVGALVMTDKKSVWAGSILSNEDKHIGLNSATTAQVAIGVLSCLRYMVEFKNESGIFPEYVPEDYILNLAKPFFGYHIGLVDYKPTSFQFEDLQRSKKQFNEQF
jgi:homospermidine synthase